MYLGEYKRKGNQNDSCKSKMCHFNLSYFGKELKNQWLENHH